MIGQIEAQWRAVELVIENGDCPHDCPYLKVWHESHGHGGGMAESFAECELLQSVAGRPQQCPKYEEPKCNE